MKFFKKILLTSVFLCLFTSLANAQFLPVFQNTNKTDLQRLTAIGGLTFSKDYSNLPTGTVTEAQLNADLAVGSPVADFTSARSASAPATYVDDNGVIQLVTTADVGRIQGGYYDATGFHTVDSNGKSAKGLMIEAEGTNLFVNGAFDANSAWSSTNWQYSGTTRWTIAYSGTGAATLSTSDDSKYLKSCQIAVTNDGDSVDDVRFRNADLLSLANATTYTVSFWIKASAAVSVTYQIEEGNDDFTVYNALGGFSTVENTWIRVIKSFSGLVGGADVNDARFALYLGNIGNVTYNIESFKLEPSPSATSFIPTTTASLPRPADILKYAILNNRTAATESIFVKFAPESNHANDGIDRYLITTETINRSIRKVSSGSTIRNIIDGTVGFNGTTVCSANTSYVTTFICYGENEAQNANTFLNGLVDGVGTTTNYTIPAWGSVFAIGSLTSGIQQYNGIIQSVDIYNRAVSAADVLNHYNIRSN